MHFPPWRSQAHRGTLLNTPQQLKQKAIRVMHDRFERSVGLSLKKDVFETEMLVNRSRKAFDQNDAIKGTGGEGEGGGGRGGLKFTI